MPIVIGCVGDSGSRHRSDTSEQKAMKSFLSRHLLLISSQGAWHARKHHSYRRTSLEICQGKMYMSLTRYPGWTYAANDHLWDLSSFAVAFSF